MLVIEKIISHLEKVNESTISDMTKVAPELDRNRLSGFLKACEEIGVVESIGKASHRKYRLKNTYKQLLSSLDLKVQSIESHNTGRKKWHYPHKRRLKERKIIWSNEIPEGNDNEAM